MSEIKNKNLYPDEGTPVLKHYSEFDSVYVGLLPFFKLDKEHCDTNSSKKVISIEEARMRRQSTGGVGSEGSFVSPSSYSSSSSCHNILIVVSILSII